MRNVNVWLCGFIVGVVLAGTAMLVGTPSTISAVPEPVVVKDHWRHHDGHWSYWYEPDKRWYYTDGSNWFYDDADTWRVYGFDKGFGREGFERGEYKVPGPDVKIVVPRHHVFRPR